jgi:hypothetical protein
MRSSQLTAPSIVKQLSLYRKVEFYGRSKSAHSLIKACSCHREDGSRGLPAVPHSQQHDDCLKEKIKCFGSPHMRRRFFAPCSCR